MDRGRKWRNLKQRLRLKGLGCCGTSWGFGVSSQMQEREEEQEEEERREEIRREVVVGQIPAATGMNLAAALAAERHFRAARGTEGVRSTPERVSLMWRMVEEEEEREGGDGGRGVGVGLKCIVCMERGKGAAFIPCGHTFCRVCSRELWLNRGSCPLCNRSILEILDIF